MTLLVVLRRGISLGDGQPLDAAGLERYRQLLAEKQQRLAEKQQRLADVQSEIARLGPEAE